MKYIRLIFLLSLLVLGVVLAQDADPDESERTRIYLERAEKAREKGLYEQAIENYLPATNIFRQKQDWEAFVISSSKLAECYLDLSDYDKANSFLSKAYQIAESKFNGDNPAAAPLYNTYGRYYQEKENDFDRAIELYEKALEIESANGADIEPETKVRTLLLLANLYGQFGEYENQIDALNRANAILEIKIPKKHPLQGDFLAEMGTYHVNQTDYDLSRDFHERALNFYLELYGAEHPKVADGYEGLSSSYKGLKAFDLQRDYLAKAFDIRLKTMPRNSLAVAENYMRIASLNLTTGDYDNAIEYYEQALDIYTSIYGEEHPDVAAVYNGIARCFHQKKNLDSEFIRLQKALKIQEKTLPEKHVDLAETYNNLGGYYSSQDDYEQQVEYFQKAVDIWKENFGDSSYFVSIGYNNLGKVYANYPGEEYKGLEYLEAALGIRKKLFKDPYDARNAKVYFNLGYYFYQTGDWMTAVDYFQKSLVSSSNGFKYDKADIYSNPPIQTANNLIQILEAAEYKAKALEKLYQNKTHQLQDLESALNTYNYCLDVIDTIRTEVRTAKSREELIERSGSVYESAIAVALELSKVEQKDLYLNQGFVIAERSKAFELLQAVKDAEAKGVSGIPDSLLQLERQMNLEIAYYKEQYYKAKQDFDTAQLRIIDRKMFDTRAAYKSLIRDIETSYPQYYKAKFSPDIADVKDVQQEILPSKGALIQYYWGKDNLYTFVISKNDVNLYQTPITESLEENVQRFRAILSNYDLIMNDPASAYDWLITLGYELYLDLLASAFQKSQDYESLTLIPDGQLGVIPFEAFLTERIENNGKIDFATLPYLIKRCRVNYSYSATLLLGNMKQPMRRGTRSIAFAPSYDTKSDQKFATGDMQELKETAQPLPGAQAEVKSMSQHFNGAYYFGEDATETHFKESFSDPKKHYKIVHMAMHGFVNDRDAEQSFLAFTPTPKDTASDHNLFAYELYNLNVSADLVVLSACETGYGRYMRGEGVMSLARGFMFSGSSSILMTLWKVDDKNSAQLISSFYDYLSKGEAKDKSLQKAKLDYLENAKQYYSHPAYWAGFVSIGSPKPFKSGLPAWAWGLIGLGVAGTGFAAYRKFGPKKAA